MEAIRFTNTSVDKTRIDDSSRYPLGEFIQEDDPSRQYQSNSDFSYYTIPDGHSLTKLTKDTYIPKVITSNKQNTPHTKDVECYLDLINTKGTEEQEVQNKLINSQPTKEASWNNIQTSVPITKPLVPEVPQSQIIHHAVNSSHSRIPQTVWSRDQRTKLVNIIGEPTEGMLTRSMAAKLIAASKLKRHIFNIGEDKVKSR
ncbi:hypothetical protein Tco_0935862 [Tanacetum coccineum]